MSTIFSQALSALKTNQSLTKKRSENQNKRVIKNDGSSGGRKGSVLDRIKINKGANKQRREITIRRESPEPEVPGIHKKIIRKDKGFVLNRPSQKVDSDQVWKHDKYVGPSVSIEKSVNCTVFVRNLPDLVDREALSSILDDDDSISGIRIDNGTAEVNFSRQDAAQRAAGIYLSFMTKIETLNGKILRGRTLKAGIVGELNAALYNPKHHTVKSREEEKTDRREFVPSKKMHMDDETYNKPNKSSILNRIKKNH